MPLLRWRDNCIWFVCRTMHCEWLNNYNFKFKHNICELHWDVAIFEHLGNQFELCSLQQLISCRCTFNNWFPRILLKYIKGLMKHFANKQTRLTSDRFSIKILDHTADWKQMFLRLFVSVNKSLLTVFIWRRHWLTNRRNKAAAMKVFFFMIKAK